MMRASLFSAEKEQQQHTKLAREGERRVPPRCRRMFLLEEKALREEETRGTFFCNFCIVVGKW